MNKRILSMFLAVLLLLGLVPAPVHAQEVPEKLFNLLSGVAVAEEDDYTFEEIEPNDTMEESDYIFSDSTVVGTLSKTDLVDYYCVIITSKSEVVLASAATAEGLELSIVDIYGEEVASGSDLGVTEGLYTDAISVVLDPGTYFITTHDTSSEKTDLTYALYYLEYPTGVERISGKTRYETSEKIIYKYTDIYSAEKVDNLIIASGKNFADALAGSYLSATCNAPILIVGDDLNIEWVNEHVSKNGVIYILGGTAAVSQEIEDSLSGYEVERLSGKTRYETNMKILKKGLEITEEIDTILVCTGKNFADSLSASATGLPILLVENSGLTDLQTEFLNSEKGSDIFILGGEGAVSKTMEDTISAYGMVDRIGGKTRYETSVNIAETFFPGAATAVVAYAGNFPDGLCGGPVAYTMYAPLILTAANNEAAAVKYMKENNISSGLVLGGTGALPDATAKKVFGVSQIDLY